MKLVYFKNFSTKKSFNHEFFDIVEFRPSIKKVYLKGEPQNIKITLVRFWFQIMTFGKAKMICVTNDAGETIHSSYVVPKCFKFPFLGKNDYIIGPCNTAFEYRGQGIYPKVLEFIVSNIGKPRSKFYMCVDDGNFSSIKGIEKAGFKKIGTVRKSRFLKRYYIEL